MKRISVYLSKILAEQKIINKEDIDVCAYGIETFSFSCFEILSVLLISIIFDNFVATLLLFISFIPLRMYAGGYHAETKHGCYLVMLGVYLIFTLVYKYLPYEYVMYFEIVTNAFTVFMVFVFSPIVNYKKRVTEVEKKHYKNIALCIMMVQVAIILFFLIVLPNNRYGLAFSIGQLTVAISMLTAIVKNKIKGGELHEKSKRTVKGQSFPRNR